ncbi:MAG: amidase family protein [Burkholderiaceae bacterium]|nr:amidase family protein [Burkholderiaceae bacterium]
MNPTSPEAGTGAAPWRRDAGSLAAAIRHGEFSAREALESCIARMQVVNPVLNAVVCDLSSEARASADAADAALRRGEQVGPLHGVPVTVKVNVDQRGCATTNGVVAYRDTIAPDDSPVVANLRRAGAVIFGRTNTPAFSWRWFTDNALHGRTLNPWSAAITPGGSSGGAAAAVAAGIGPIAHGNDIGGSVRYPAYACGVVGLRPGFGRVPAYNPSAAGERALTAQIMSVQGPLTRSVADARLALAAMAQADWRNPWWTPAPLEGPAPARPIRVAVCTDIEGFAVHPSVAAAVQRAADWLAQAGFAVERASPPRFAETAALWGTMLMSDAADSMLPAIERDGDEQIRESVRSTLVHVAMTDMAGLRDALVRRTTILREWGGFLERYPIVLMPVSFEPPFRQDQDLRGPERMGELLRAQAPMLVPAVLGLPGLSVPVDTLDSAGYAGALGADEATRGTISAVPIGVQLIASRFREDLCLRAGEAIEARAGRFTPIDPFDPPVS